MSNRTDCIGLEDGTKLEEGHRKVQADAQKDWCPSVMFIQKIIAEIFGTYCVIFSGCGSVVVNDIYGKVSFPGVCIAWGLIVMVMVYSVGHISGAHFNPAVTLAFAIFRRFPWKEVPAYMAAQVLGSVMASGTLHLLFDVKPSDYFGTVPVDTTVQSFVIEIIISFILMFVISGVATDTRAIGELAGIAVGATILLNVLVAGPISGASMNPARSLGPAIVMGKYKGLWVYIVGPPVGTVFGAFAYNLVRLTDKPLREITKTSSFLKSISRN
ncbi:unnamed protein product [Victoria cruziana]